MREKFKNNKTGEIVSIVDNNNDTFIELSNGVKIVRDIFINMFTPHYDYSETVDAESFMNQKTHIKVEKPLTKEEKMKSDIAANQKKIQENTHLLQQSGQLPNQKMDVVDPEDFLNNANNLTILNEVKKLNDINTSNLVDVPDSMKTEVKFTEVNSNTEQGLSLEQKADVVRKQWNETADQRGEQKMTVRLSEDDLSKYEQVDEDDPNAILQIQNVQQKPKSKINPETGLTPREELIRKQQIDAGQGDPYSQRIDEWISNKVIEMPIIEINSEVINENNEIMENKENNIQKTNQNDIASSMFDMLEKVYDIQIDLSIKEKIAEPSFIRMFAKNLKGDIVDYYAQQILKDLLSDIPNLKKKIYDKIKQEVYGEHEELFKDIIPSNKKQTTITEEDVKYVFGKKDEEIENVIENIKENNPIKIETIIKKDQILIPGKITRTGKQQYKFVNEKGKIIDCLPETAMKKGYKAHVKN